MERSKRPLKSNSTALITNTLADFDLNLENYSLADLLTMFKLEPTFTEKDLKKSKRIVYQMHPDKSGLKPEFFLFFTKAYKILEDVLSFSQRRSGFSNEITPISSASSGSLGFPPAISSSSPPLLSVSDRSSSSSSSVYKSTGTTVTYGELVAQRQMEYNQQNMSGALEGPTGGDFQRVPTKENRQAFNEKFNRAFEEVHQGNGTLLNPLDGYGNWFKQNLTEEEKEFQENAGGGGGGGSGGGGKGDAEKIQYLKEKYRQQQLEVYRSPMEFSFLSSGSGLSMTSFDETVAHNSGMFESLQYQDLKQAYTQTMIPVTEADFESREKYQNVEQLQQARARQLLDPMNERDSIQTLDQRRRLEETQAMARAFRFAQEMEKGAQRNQQFDRHFLHIKN